MQNFGKDGKGDCRATFTNLPAGDYTLRVWFQSGLRPVPLAPRADEPQGETEVRIVVGDAGLETADEPEVTVLATSEGQ